VVPAGGVEGWGRDRLGGFTHAAHELPTNQGSIQSNDEGGQLPVEMTPADESADEVRTPYEAVVAASLNPVITMDARGRVTEFNAAAEDVFGYSRTEAVGHDMAELIIPPRLREAHRRGLARYLATGEGPVIGQRIELTAVRADGREFPVELAIVRLPGAEPPLFTGFIRDLSQRRSADEALRALAESSAAARAEADRARDEAVRLADDLQTQAAELEFQAEEAQALTHELELANAKLGSQYALLRTVLASTDDLVFAKDRDGRYVVMNEAGARLHGRPPDEIVGRTDAEIFTAALAAELRANDLEVMRSGEVRQFEESTATNGERRIYRSTKSVFRDPSGAVAGIVGVSTDITEVKRADAERRGLLDGERAARVEAERANLAKSEFLAVMSHELRTPLNAIAGYVQLLDMEIFGPLTESQKEKLRRVDRSQRHLLALINDVLNFVRIEAARVHYELADVDLGAALADLGPLIEPQLAEKGLTYSVLLPTPPNARIVVRADPDKLRQILLNLLSNAIKFTPAAGRITVDVAERRGMADSVFVRVSDSGPGIPRDKLEAIFEPFVRVDSGLTRTTEGTGLGLAISRDLARGMGGDLRARSEMGRGSSFTLTLGHSISLVEKAATGGVQP
jgi:PAS domain S-box-containing protein